MLSLQDLQAQIDEALAINSIESSYSYEFYTDLINEQRSLWLRNEYNKNRSIDPYVVQDLNCLELEIVSPIDCCITVPTGCQVLRTKKKIPNTIEFFFNKGIVTVGPADIMQPRFLLIDYSRVPYVGNGRTTKNSIYAFLYGGYMYVTSKNSSSMMMKYLTIRGIFEDPTSLGDFMNCQTNNSCWSPSDPYPINQWMWAYIKPYILQQLIQKGSFPYDNANNAQDQRTDSPSQGGGGGPQQQQGGKQ
jgi:hypothetical protein